MKLKQSQVLTVCEQRNIILNILNDFCSDADTLFEYLSHVGFDLCSVRGVHDIPSAFLGHYRIKRGEYDVDQACDHLATWPPIAARIQALKCEKGGLLPNDL